MALLDDSIPTGGTLVSQLAALVREDRVAINSLSNTLIYALLGDYKETKVVDNAISAAGSCSIGVYADSETDLTYIGGGFSGQPLIVVAVDNRVTIVPDEGNISLSIDDDYPMEKGDVILFLKVGDTWVECTRTLKET